MAVDLSKIAYEGANAAQERFESQARTRNLAASAAAEEAKTAAAEQEAAILAEAQKKFQATLRGERPAVDAGAAADGMDSAASMHERFGRALVEGGAAKRGLEMLKDGATIRKQESDVEDSRSQAKKRQMDFVAAGTELAGRVLGGARNESEFNFGVDDMVESGYWDQAQADQVKAIPWSPSKAKFFGDRATTEKDRVAEQRQQLEFEDLSRHRTLTRADNEARTRMQATRDAEQKRQNEFTRKGGDNKASSTVPTSDELKSAKSVIVGRAFQGRTLSEDDADLTALTNQIATRAKGLVKANKALTWDVALSRAFMEAKDANDWYTETPMRGDTDVVYKPTLGRGPSNPIPLQGEIKPGTLKKGQYYILPDGRRFFVTKDGRHKLVD